MMRTMRLILRILLVLSRSRRQSIISRLNSVSAVRLSFFGSGRFDAGLYRCESEMSDTLGYYEEFQGTPADRFIIREPGIENNTEEDDEFCPDMPEGNTYVFSFEIVGRSSDAEPYGWCPGDPEWTLEIRDNEEQVARTFTGQEINDPETGDDIVEVEVEWDGNDINGEPVDPGEYTYNFRWFGSQNVYHPPDNGDTDPDGEFVMLRQVNGVVVVKLAAFSMDTIQGTDNKFDIYDSVSDTVISNRTE